MKELWLLLIAAVLASPAQSAADLSGPWRVRWASFTRVIDITQVGSTVSFVMADELGMNLSFSGNVMGADAGFLATSASPPGPCDRGIGGRIDPTDGALEGSVIAYPPCPSNPQIRPVRLDRCECFDGNSNDGDGCDASCHVEPCYDCSGHPSVCTPRPDGAPCDDLAACTSGETCTATICGGGSPVSPCVDLTGGWSLHFSLPEFMVETDSPYTFTQRNTEIEAQSAAGIITGTINPATGVFHLEGFYDPQCIFSGPLSSTFDGQAALDGESLTGAYVDLVRTSVLCDYFAYAITGSRCGGGTVDPSEECDDGNVVNGDGCDSTCNVEPCYSCIGSPSACTTLPDGTSCDDDEECTNATTCQAGACTGTAEPDGTSCSDEDICTQGDACAQGVCTGTALPCGPCEMCDGVTPACIPRPDSTPCNDGDLCTHTDICQAGACVGLPVTCPDCYGCDAGACVGAPRTSCLAPAVASGAKLAITDAIAPQDDRFSWRWRGHEAAPPALGDPTQSTYYALCVYDESTNPPTVLMSRPAAQVICPDQCWTPRKNGFSFRSSLVSGWGISRIDLRAKPNGRTKVVVRGMGADVDPPTAPLSLPLRVQLQAVDTSNSTLQTCFEAEYGPAGIRVNDDGVFRAGATGP